MRSGGTFWAVEIDLDFPKVDLAFLVLAGILRAAEANCLESKQKTENRRQKCENRGIFTEIEAIF